MKTFVLSLLILLAAGIPPLHAESGSSSTKDPLSSLEVSALESLAKSLIEKTFPESKEESSREEFASVMGSFDSDGNYVPKDKSVRKLYRSRDLKTFIDGSLRGYGIASGLAYELKDGMTKFPLLKRRVNTTVDLGASSQSVGLHFGIKALPIVDLGGFLGVKWNFQEDRLDATLGVQILKLDL